MMYILRIILVFLVFLGYDMYLMNKLKYSFGKSWFLSLVLVMFVMSIFSFLNTLKIGFYLTSILGLILVGYYIIKSIIEKKNYFSFIKDLSFFVLIFFMVIIYLATSRIHVLLNWDECSYWATMVKRLFYFNSYIGGEHFNSMYYPPALTSFNYFIVKILGFKDASIYYAQHLFVFSGFLFFISNLKWKHFFQMFVSIVCLSVFAILILSSFWLTLYSEMPLIILLASAFCLLFIQDSKYDFFFIIILLCNATWVKSNGIIASIAVILLAFSQLIIKLYKKNKSETYLQVIKKNINLVITMFIPVIAYKVFSTFLKLHHIVNRQGISLEFNSFFKNVFEKENEIADNYFRALGYNYNYSVFNISSILLIAFIILGFMLLKKLHDKELEKNKYVELAIFFGFILYAGALLYSYLNMFSVGEANILASFDRYINTYVGAVGFGFLSVLIYYLNSENRQTKKNMFNFLIVITLLLFTVTSSGDIFRNFKKITSDSVYKSYDAINKGQEFALRYKSLFDEDDKVAFIAYEDYGLTIWSSIYYLTPLKTADPRFDGDVWSIRKPDTKEVLNTVEYSTKDYIKYLKNNGFTHVMVIITSEEFSEQYSDIFETTNSVIKEGVYRFDSDNNKLVFVK